MKEWNKIHKEALTLTAILLILYSKSLHPSLAGWAILSQPKETGCLIKAMGLDKTQGEKFVPGSENGNLYESTVNLKSEDNPGVYCCSSLSPSVTALNDCCPSY